MQQTAFNDIHIGDILIINYGELCPCDMLILATSDQLNGRYTCQVDSMLENGQCLRQEKDAVTLTKNFAHWTEDSSTIWYFLVRLTGKVTYEANTKSDDILGSFKLRADPKVENFDKQKILKRGSVLKSRYALGMVLYNGRSNFGLSPYQFLCYKMSGIERKMRNFSITLIVFSLILSLLSSLLYRKLEDRVRNSDLAEVSTAVGFITHLSMYLSLFPATASLLITLSNALMSIILEIKNKKLQAKLSEMEEYQQIQSMRTSSLRDSNSIKDKSLEKCAFKVLNPYVVSDLGEIDDVFVDKSGTLSSNSYDVKTISTKNKLYASAKKNFVTEQLIAERDEIIQDKYDSEDQLDIEEGAQANIPHQDMDAPENIPSERVSIKAIEVEMSFPRFETILPPREVLDSPRQDSGKKLKLPQEQFSPSSNGKVSLSIGKNHLKSKRGSGVNSKQLIEYSPAQVSHHSGFKYRQFRTIREDVEDEYAFYEDFKSEPDIPSIIKMFSLCHTCKPELSGFDGSLMEETSLLALASEFGTTLIEAGSGEESISDTSNSYYSIRMKNGETVTIGYYFALKQDRRHRRFSILVEDSVPGKAKLYVRGSDKAMRKLINFEEGIGNYESALNFNKINGYKSLVFASKVISSEKAAMLREEYIQARQANMDQDLKLYKLAKSLETDLDLEAIVGFENTLKPGTKTAINSMVNMGIHVHIASGDNLEHCLMTAQNLRLMTTGYHHIEFNSEETGRGQFKRVLDMIGKEVVKMNVGTKRSISNSFKDLDDVGSNQSSRDVNIVISGKTIEYICTNQYFMEHFKFILEFTKSVVAYECSPDDKRQLVALVRSLDRKTVAIGDGYNDIAMLQEADIGIQMSNCSVGLQFGDIMVNGLVQVTESMAMSCRDWHNNLSLAIHSVYQYSMLMAIIDLTYQAFIGFTGTSVFTSFNIVFTMIMAVPISLTFVFIDRYLSKEARKTVSGLYCENSYLTKTHHLRLLLVHLVINSNSSLQKQYYWD